MTTPKITLSLFLLLSFLVGTTSAWNDLGHRVVAQIAWSDLDNATKARVINALKSAPSDSRITKDLPANSATWPNNVEDASFSKVFQFVATWPDFVRPRDNPRATDKYHHGDWHYINIFWTADGQRSSMSPKGNLVNKMQEFTGGSSAENSAIQLAWLAHLIGDIHQPLHCSARITNIPFEQDGDRGGNEFCLRPDCLRNGGLQLHSFWDSTLTRNYDAMPGESVFQQSQRLAEDISQRFPKQDFTEFDPTSEDFDAWAEEGLEKAMTVAYPTSLKRNKTPSSGYRRKVLRTSEPSVALAGYRLAAILRSRFL